MFEWARDEELLPTEPTRFGATSNPGLDQLSTLLGGLFGELGGAALSNPQVEAALRQTVGVTCQTKAKEGVIEAVKENQGTILLWTVGILGVLLTGHFFLSALALNLAFPRKAFREIRAAFPVAQ